MMFPGPSLAERARTTVRLAPTLRVSTEAGCGEADRHGSDEIGSLVLVVPEGHPVARAARDSPGGRPATVRATDLCPVPAPDRVRGHAILTGWVHEPAAFLRRPLALRTAGGGNIEDLSELLDIGHGRTVLYVNITEVAVRVGRGTAVRVPAGDYATADVDPLAATESTLLSHLAGRHPEELAALAALIPEPVRARAGRITPLRLDRYGLVLRAGIADVRLPFTEPLNCRRELPARMRDLLARAAEAATTTEATTTEATTTTGTAS
jgi:Domain of unknown function (DUF2470)